MQQQVASWFLENQRRYRLRRESVSRCIGRLVDARALAASHNVLSVASTAKQRAFACECWQPGE